MVDGDRFGSEGEDSPEPQPAKPRPTAGRHARSRVARTRAATPATAGASGASEPAHRAETPDSQPSQGQFPDSQSPDGQSPDSQSSQGQSPEGHSPEGTSPDAEPTVPLRSVPSPAGPPPGSDADGWLPPVQLPSVPSPAGPPPGSDADGWLPFAASDEPTSDRDRAAGLAAMIAAAAVVALCGVGGILAFLTGSGDEGAPPAVAAARTSAPPTASPDSTPSSAPAAVAPAAPTDKEPHPTPSSRATETPAARPAVPRPATPVRNRDRAPLTIQEVFGSDRVTVQGREYRLVSTDGATDCAAGASGDTASELRRSACTQLIRAVAVDGSGRIAVTVGVANLPDAAAAGRVVATTHGRGGFTAMWARRGHRGGGDGYRETGAVGRFVVYGIGARSERGGADRAAMQAVADLRGVVAGRLSARV